jgi:hypothetical protein
MYFAASDDRFSSDFLRTVRPTTDIGKDWSCHLAGATSVATRLHDAKSTKPLFNVANPHRILGCAWISCEARQRQSGSLPSSCQLNTRGTISPVEHSSTRYSTGACTPTENLPPSGRVLQGAEVLRLPVGAHTPIPRQSSADVVLN